MKKILFFGIILSVSVMACKKKEAAPAENVQALKADYDTTAIDSFSPGATSVDVVEQIRMSSQKYHDSVKAALLLQEEEKKLQDELDKETKKKAEEEKKKKAVENQTAEATNTTN